MNPDRMCGTGGCKKEAIGFIGKFGETRIVGSSVNTPPGIPIAASYCATHEEIVKRVMASL
jgi:hypothetical protein